MSHPFDGTLTVDELALIIQSCQKDGMGKTVVCIGESLSPGGKVNGLGILAVAHNGTALVITGNRVLADSMKRGKA